MSGSQASGTPHPAGGSQAGGSQAGGTQATSRIVAALDSLAAADVAALDDSTLRGELLDLMTIGHRVSAELVRRLDIFDRRGLCHQDGFRTTTAWLRAFTRRSGAVAQRLVAAARLLRRLPKLAIAAQAGDVPDEHVHLVARLTTRVDLDRVAEVEPTLTDAARQLDPGRFATVCERVAAHLDPDGPDPEREFQRRSFILSPTSRAVGIRGQLDPEGAAALATALDAVMTPPAAGDDRTATQRRADALVDLARRHLSAGALPDVGGQRPQVGLLVHPQTLSPQALARLADIQRDSLAGQRLQAFLNAANNPPPAADWTRPIDPPASGSGDRCAGPGRATQGGLGDRSDNYSDDYAPHTTRPAPDDSPATTATDPARQLFGRTTAGMRSGLLTTPPAEPLADLATPGRAHDRPPAIPPPAPAESAAGRIPTAGIPPVGGNAAQPTASSSTAASAVSGNSPSGRLGCQGPATDGTPTAAPATTATGTTATGTTATGTDRPTGRPAWNGPGWADPPWLNWVGPIAPQTAQRIACDAELYRVVMDPDTGMPLDVGRTHRLVPHWIRRALYARDRGCRWPGCTTPAEWTDAHHIDWWSKGGNTSADKCLLICRHHHVLLHEGGWRIHLDITTGNVTVTRPDGSPYPLNPSPSWRSTTSITRPTGTGTNGTGTADTG